MFFSKSDAQAKRKKLKKQLASGTLHRFPGAFSPVVSKLIEELGFDGVYISGAVLSADLGLPDIGLTTASEVIARGHAIASATNLPALIDIDTGFGAPINAARTVQGLEEHGLSGCHIEDQVHPKRCGHLDHKQLIDVEAMVKKIKAGVEARRDSNFVLIARTDARATEGLAGAIERAKQYIAAGADMIFPEALEDESEFEKFRKAIDVPLLVNMTEFGKTKLLTKKQLEDLGINLVIYPVTTFRLALKAVEDGLKTIFNDGTQAKLLDSMQTRKRLYELLEYEGYNEFDKGIYNFKIK
ncbi:methylisocitrate lyase [Oligoflexia bacterium]|nr:methylisocitrate lyase [Oligoflexia bacterium]